MSLERAIYYAIHNPIKQRGRNSISRFAAILTDGKTTFVGRNSYKTHPLVKLFSPNEQALCIHAELDALRHVWNGSYKDLSGYTMYVARVTKTGSVGLAKPCEVCQAAIIYFGVGNCEWTT